VRLTLLDACYLAGGLDEGGHTALSAPQLRFVDVDVVGWAARCTCTSPSSPPRTTRAGVLGSGTTAVHATHLTGADIATLGAGGTGVCVCPRTEEVLADGIGPSRALHDAGAVLSLGSDQHALTDLLAEARALEMHERLTSGRRGRFAPAALAAALTNHASLGWPDAGRLQPAARADLVALRLDTPRPAPRRGRCGAPPRPPTRAP
jgi:cytosine/adenosine deaminase-related metal-dependent hydrolase